MRAAALLFTLIFTTTGPFGLQAQWSLQDSRTTADLRGIDNVGGGVAWASGTNGTVLRTEDAGFVWQRCTIPLGAEHLDFRGIQAFDNNTAIVMSSGPGDQSRLYKTTDGCQSWKLVATNPDKNGFWDAVRFHSEVDVVGEKSGAKEALILGDSVDAKLKLWEWKEGWEERELEPTYHGPRNVIASESSFAASNSVLQIATTPQLDKTWKYKFRWASGTATKAFISYVRDEQTKTCEPCREESGQVEVPMSGGTDSAGIFSFVFRSELIGVAVGGDFKKQESDKRSASVTSDGGLSWKLSTTFPHGYRSSVAYDPTTHTWLTVGPNGTDISTDDGRNWRPLRPNPAFPDTQPDEDQHWNALSLPFVVGPHGRIATLRPSALAPATPAP